MSDLSVVLRHALTVLAGQLAVMAYGVTDTIVAGRHAQASLAALSIGSALFVSVYVSLQGALQALLPIWAEQRGAHQPLAIGRSLRQALYLCALASALGMAVLLAPGALLRWAEVPLSLQDEVTHYLAVLAFGLPPALLFRTYCTLNQALGHPLLVTWLQVLGLVIKIPLSIWFTFGGAGLPAQGAVGCAWATLVVACCQCALAVWLLRTQSLYTPLQLWQRLERPDPAQLAAFMRLGLPAGLAILVEVTSFTLMALLIARQGTLAAASHQIAANLVSTAQLPKEVFENVQRFAAGDASAQLKAKLLKLIYLINKLPADAAMDLGLKATEEALADLLQPLEKSIVIGAHQPTVIMVAGVNGAGKTTSIGKLTKYLADHDQQVLLAAADTFRAAAREQLGVWATRNTVEIVSQEGGDPAAVSFDAVTAGKARGKDVVLVDTAGRLPTQLHLMQELQKIKRVITKADGSAPHEVLLVIDGNTGQNALHQVKAFDEALGLTGLIVTKLDGTAKGGVLAAIAQEKPIPVYFIGVGEQVQDLQTFNAREFAQALLG